MSFTFNALRVLARAPGDKLQSRAIAEELGVSMRISSQNLSAMTTNNLISKVKIAGDRENFYFLNDDQYAEWLKRKAQAEQEASLAEKLAEADEKKEAAMPTFTGVTLSGLANRIVFLRNLKENTIFADHPVLRMIQTDYDLLLQRLRGD